MVIEFGEPLDASEIANLNEALTLANAPSAFLNTGWSSMYCPGSLFGAQGIVLNGLLFASHSGLTNFLVVAEYNSSEPANVIATILQVADNKDQQLAEVLADTGCRKEEKLY
jgi:hypothetical protein